MRRTVSCLLPVLAFLCIGWADNWEELKATARTVTSVKADFIQEKHLPILSKPLVSIGSLSYQRPRSLRWEYSRPVASILLMHDGRLRRFVASPPGFSEESGGGLDAMRFVLEEITQWLMGRFDENPMFQAQLEAERRIVLRPREASMGAVIERIVIDLASQPGIIQSVTIYENQDAYTQITFANTLLNQQIDAAVFMNAP